MDSTITASFIAHVSRSYVHIGETEVDNLTDRTDRTSPGHETLSVTADDHPAPPESASAIGDKEGIQLPEHETRDVETLLASALGAGEQYAPRLRRSRRLYERAKGGMGGNIDSHEPEQPGGLASSETIEEDDESMTVTGSEYASDAEQGETKRKEAKEAGEQSAGGDKSKPSVAAVVSPTTRAYHARNLRLAISMLIPFFLAALYRLVQLKGWFSETNDYAKAEYRLL